MNNQELVNLCTRAWSIPALGLMARGVSARVSPLAAEAGCGRSSMAASVEHLLALGLMERNPGHGHPLRPEFRLTLAGEAMADWALELSSFLKTENDRAMLRTKWSLPLMRCLSEEKRYSDLRRDLNPVTDRALASCLTRLTDCDWIRRNVANRVSPIRVSYQSYKIGIRVHHHLQKLPKVA